MERVESNPERRVDLREIADFYLGEAYARFPIASRPSLEWRPYRTTAGRADLVNSKILLSTHVLDDELKLRATLLHEYAHLLSFSRHGLAGRGHGRHWRQAMLDLGMEPSVTHRYECRRNRQRQLVRYRCASCGAFVDRRRRLPRRRRYEHVGCGGAIRLHAVYRVE
jgi:predicted SprT family Zn-dependent metalloprotease